MARAQYDCTSMSEVHVVKFWSLYTAESGSRSTCLASVDTPTSVAPSSLTVRIMHCVQTVRVIIQILMLAFPSFPLIGRLKCGHQNSGLEINANEASICVSHLPQTTRH
ncbi:hypothetical protein PAXRUDRAFT_239058 [Paxillus rubicundulus Ve08.2h10]|uniref:Uncharacterized protein n=1 Tax=Paxillus rubicundulus Ve08.2h10 TaxID=930991 RepID=A0A0D0EBA6_9AGAM|nr:hypothetical protein PAXRUDRAFT_239058 [Paxillus rubicundulus Ve08.2h10]